MKVKLVCGKEKRMVAVGKAATVEKLVSGMKLDPDLSIISLNGKVAHPSSELKEGDVVEVIDIAGCTKRKLG
ncbi:MoaD/ThiS family protein [Candidatus Micrarchaeota archaeon]|nr:MoaD/ThiS family protein [Candidatus Micrarchaeota archaeon]